MRKEKLGIILGISLGIICLALIVGAVWIQSRSSMSGNDTQTENNADSLGDTQMTETDTIETEITESVTTETEDIPENTESIEDTEIIGSETNTVVPPQVQVPSGTPTKDYPYYIKVNRTTNCVTIYTKDGNGNYTVPVKAMICSVGIDGNTPTGVFQTTDKYVWRELFGNTYGHYTTRITGHILFHSVPYYKPQKNQLITEDYNMLGTAASAGCIRLSVADAKWIYDNCASGVTVEIFDGTEPDPLTRPNAIVLNPSDPYSVWDPTDPDPSNPWKTVKPIISGEKTMVFERNEPGDYTSHVSAKDYWGSPLTVSVQGDVDFCVCGSYSVTYSAVDSIGNSISSTVQILVKDTKSPVISQTESIRITDDSSHIEDMIIHALAIRDNGEVYDKGKVSMDLTNLILAMEQKNYGTVTCTVTVTDETGNISDDFSVRITYYNSDLDIGIISDEISQLE